MDTINYKYFKTKFFLSNLVFIALLSCDREASEKTTFASFTNNPEVFIDTFSSGLDYYPFGDSFFEAFEVDEKDTYKGSASMRFDIPNFGEGYGGAIFRDDNGGRNLTEYNALTFWAKGTKGTTLAQIGFGQDFGENKYQVTVSDFPITTGWKQYVIPIPDASKLVKEQGMFWYAAGATETNTEGFSFWVDELQFENLNTIGQPRPAILGGVDTSQTGVIGQEITLTGLTETFNLESGDDLTMTVPPSYYTFTSSDIEVARVSELGVVSIVGEGTATITASIAGNTASGSLIIESKATFDHAPTPTADANSVISIFSDAYTNVPVDFYNGFYEPFQTTISNDFVINGDNILNYENYNFVGIEFNKNVSTIDATEKTMLHVDIFVPDSFDSTSTIKINLRDYGADKSFDGGDDSIVSQIISATSDPALISGQWISIDIDITSLTNRNNLGQIVFDAEGNTTPRPSAFYVDNIYLY